MKSDLNKLNQKGMDPSSPAVSNTNKVIQKGMDPLSMMASQLKIE